MIPNRLIVEDIISEYLERSKKEDALSKIGIEPNGLLTSKLLDWAMDIIGFPPDNTLEFKTCRSSEATDLRTDYSHLFCRDYLRNSTLINEGCSDNIHFSVQEYVDYLYAMHDQFRKEQIDHHPL